MLIRPAPVRWFVFIAVVCCIAPGLAPAGDQPQWGALHSRNMVSDETNLPHTFDRTDRTNVRWYVPIGTKTYATPIVAEGRVLIGTNNAQPRNPRHKGDRGVLMCFDEKSGELCWQLVVPKRPNDKYEDWPYIGVCSPPTVADGLVYVVTNRGEVACLDLDGLADGNDGPFRDEAKFMTPPGQATTRVSPSDADIIWRFDIVTQAGIHPHDSPHASIMLDGNLLYLNTSNGTDNTHAKIRKPDGPGLIVLDKRTGRMVARDRERMAPRTFHCTWSSPAMGTVNGRKLVFFGGGDGVCYAFEALDPASPPAEVATLKKVWSFDCDPGAPKEDVHKYLRNRKEGPTVIKAMPVFHDGRLYVVAGGDIWWGKEKSWLKCIDPGGRGDVTKTHLVWSYPLSKQAVATPAVHDALVYVGDCGRVMHCVDAKTGKAVWTHDAGGDIWGSPLVADGKVYIGTRRRYLWVFAAGRSKKVLAKINMDGPIHGAVTAANSTLYLATMARLYAIAKTAPK